jgi:hypothetical protein
MKTIQFLSIAYIELIRGIPLITILFMVAVMLPLFFTEGIEFDKLLTKAKSSVIVSNKLGRQCASKGYKPYINKPIFSPIYDQQAAS